MSIREIYHQRRVGWDSLLKLRKKETLLEPADHKNPAEEKQKEYQEEVLAQADQAKQAVDDTLSPEARIAEICDPGSFRELFREVSSGNPLQFPGYEEKKKKYQDALKEEDAFLAGYAKINRRKIAIGFLDGRFLMGSMGTAVGEKVTLLAEYAQKKKLPLIIFSASGGARMQEGMFSLMQMSKTAAAIERFRQQGGLYISCLTNPTTGGVSASFASLGDIILAEPGALICFAGPRVIEQTIGQTLPKGFQRSEFLLEHGMIDRIVERERWRPVLNQILLLHGYERG